MFKIKVFRELIAYKKSIMILKEFINENLDEKDIKEIRFDITKICGYIAQSEGCALYPSLTEKYLNKALKWTNILDKKIRLLNLEDKKRKKYTNETAQIRRILISLKNKLEEKKNEQFNKYIK